MGKDRPSTLCDSCQALAQQTGEGKAGNEKAFLEVIAACFAST